MIVPPGLSVCHVDEALLVLDKPAGLLSVPGRGPDKADCLSARAQARFPDALVVHRLDMSTSGLVVMGRGASAQRQLSLDFAARRVHKRYVAVVQGQPPLGQDPEAWQLIDLPLIVDWPNRPRSKVDHQIGKPSLTRWRCCPEAAALDTGTASHCRLELEPVTGRSHQLRLHLQAIGHPILGDELYGDEAVQAASPRLLLHATTLEITHPVSGERLRFHSPAPF